MTTYLAREATDKFDGYHRAMTRPNKELWCEAIQDELDSLSNMRTRELAGLSTDKKAIGTK